MSLDTSIRERWDLCLDVVQVRFLLPLYNHAKLIHELVLFVENKDVEEFEHFVHLVWELHDVFFGLLFSFLGLLLKVSGVLAEILNSF
jgi:hypothetical protein